MQTTEFLSERPLYQQIALTIEKTVREFGLFYILKPSFSAAPAPFFARPKEPGQPNYNSTSTAIYVHA